MLPLNGMGWALTIAAVEQIHLAMVARGGCCRRILAPIIKPHMRSIIVRVVSEAVAYLLR